MTSSYVEAHRDLPSQRGVRVVPGRGLAGVGGLRAVVPTRRRDAYRTHARACRTDETRPRRNLKKKRRLQRFQ